MTEELEEYHHRPRRDVEAKELLIEMIKGYISDKFYGRLEIIFEKGKITHCKEIKSIKF